MPEENICRFIPPHTGEDALCTLNFVYERQCHFPDKLIMKSTFGMYLVSAGEGLLRTMQGVAPLRAGDLFFTFPAKSFSIVSVEQLEYLYISFQGLRANRIFDRMEYGKNRDVYPGFEKLLPFWRDSMQNMEDGNADLLAESVLLFTFSQLVRHTPLLRGADSVMLVKKYIDEHSCDADLTLESVAKQMNYNPKYLSSLFHKSMGLPFVKYLENLRVQHACALMEQGLRSVKDISFLCGYRDPLYFSRVFKRNMGITARQHIETIERSHSGG